MKKYVHIASGTTWQFKSGNHRTVVLKCTDANNDPRYKVGLLTKTSPRNIELFYKEILSPLAPGYEFKGF